MVGIAAGGRVRHRLRSRSPLAEGGKNDEARAAFGKLAKEGAPATASSRGFREAAELAKTDAPAAVAAYDALANNSSLDRSLRDLAAIRAGLILVDTAPLAELTRGSSR